MGLLQPTDPFSPRPAMPAHPEHRPDARHNFSPSAGRTVTTDVRYRLHAGRGLVAGVVALLMSSGRAGAQTVRSGAPVPQSTAQAPARDLAQAAATMDTARIIAGMQATAARLARVTRALAHPGCYAWAPTTEVLNQRRIAVVHINGINTDSAGYEANLHELKRLLCAKRVLRSADAVEGMPDLTEGVPADLWVAAQEQARRYGLNAWARYYGWDVRGSAVAAEFAGMVQAAIDRGYRVLIVPHSRGNMVTQHALGALFRARPETIGCVRVVAVAPPDVRHWPAPDRVVGLYARNDGARDFLLEPAGVPYAYSGRFRVVRTSASAGKTPLGLHAFVGTYLADPETRQELTDRLIGSAQDLRWSDCAPADAALGSPSTDSLRQLGRTLESAIKQLDNMPPAMTAADRQTLARLRGAWIDAQTNGRAYVLRVEAEGVGSMATYGKFVMPSAARLVVARRGGADSLYLVGTDSVLRARGTVRFIDPRTVSLTVEQDETPPRCNPSAPAPRRRWSRPLTVQLARVDRAVAMQAEREHVQRGSWGVALGGGCGGGL